MVKNLKINKGIWLIAACLSLIAAGIGAFNQGIYSKVVSLELLPGIVAQDAITIIAGLILVYLSFVTRDVDVKKQIVILSLLAYLFYGYGIYVIERLYNPLYLLYVAIMALSFWGIVYSLAQIKEELLGRVKAPRIVSYVSAGSLLFTAVLFYFLWTGQIIPLMRTGEKLEFTYSIYILDMVFVLPALILSGILLLKKKAFGLILTPILFFKAFTLLFSVGLGSLLIPLFGQTTNQGETVFYLSLSAVYLVFSILNFWKIDFQGQEELN